MFYLMKKKDGGDYRQMRVAESVLEIHKAVEDMVRDGTPAGSLKIFEDRPFKALVVVTDG